MDDFSSGRPKSWSVYSNANLSPSQPATDREAPWKNFGASVNAISFGFVATAILISLFLIMAIFEHLLRPRSSFPSPQDAARALESGHTQSRAHLREKLGPSQTATMPSYTSDFSVLMPGQHHPTFIAQPAPLACPREGIYWPSHDRGFNI